MKTNEETNPQAIESSTRPYAVLVKDGYVRDTQMSLLGCYVEDLFADDLVVTNDNGDKQQVEPFMERDGDGTYADDVCDFFGAVLLAIRHYPSELTEEEVINMIASSEKIPPRYLAVLPLDRTISPTEWHDRFLLL